MKKGERTRARMLDAAAALMQRQGYAATGMSQIVADSGAPKGSVYFHFPGGKEQLACEALDHSGAQWRAQLEALIDAAPTRAAAVVAVCDALADSLEQNDYVTGCPLAAVAMEVAAASDAVRETCARHYRAWEQVIGGGDVGVFVLSAIEGAMMLSRVYRDASPLRRVGRTLAAMVQPA